MVRYKGDYKKESYCTECKDWTPEPLIKSIYEYLRYGYMVAIREPNDYPQVYDDKGNTYGVQTLIPIRQINSRGHDGRFFKQITEFRSPVKCQYCGKICRGGSHNKIDKRNRKDKRIAKQENTISDSVKIKQMDDIIRLLKIQVEYENDPSLRLDDPEAKKVGTIGSMVRGQIEKTLEEVEGIRKKTRDVT